jgi:hypothetical protein
MGWAGEASVTGAWARSRTYKVKVMVFEPRISLIVLVDGTQQLCRVPKMPLLLTYNNKIQKNIRFLKTIDNAKRVCSA